MSRTSFVYTICGSERLRKSKVRGTRSKALQNKYIQLTFTLIAK